MALAGRSHGQRVMLYSTARRSREARADDSRLTRGGRSGGMRLPLLLLSFVVAFMLPAAAGRRAAHEGKARERDGTQNRKKNKKRFTRAVARRASQILTRAEQSVHTSAQLPAQEPGRNLSAWKSLRKRVIPRAKRRTHTTPTVYICASDEVDYPVTIS